MPLSAIVVPCLSDNYAYLVHDTVTGNAAVVDVPDAAPILAALEAHKLTLTEIWITHHHYDHVDGVDPLRDATGAKVTGAAADAHRLPDLDRPMAPGDTFTFEGAQVTVMDAPGHTIGHIAFHIPSAAMLFTADSLMALGCGRLFEGTPAQMWDTLSGFAALAPETLVYSGHEYTAANARFALSVDPENPDLVARADSITKAREKGTPTVPVSLAEECATNPFLRAADPALKARLGMDSAPDAEVFAEIRRRKDNF